MTQTPQNRIRWLWMRYMWFANAFVKRKRVWQHKYYCLLRTLCVSERPFQITIRWSLYSDYDNMKWHCRLCACSSTSDKKKWFCLDNDILIRLISQTCVQHLHKRYPIDESFLNAMCLVDLPNRRPFTSICFSNKWSPFAEDQLTKLFFFVFLLSSTQSQMFVIKM